MRTRILAGLLLVTSALAANAATCSNVATGGYISATPSAGTAACLTSSNSGNINGNDDDVNNFAPGYLTMDVSNETGKAYELGDGALSIIQTSTGQGTWALDLSKLVGYNNFVLGIKDGNNNPDWAAFLFSSLAVSGTWAIFDGDKYKDLSHAVLYGQACDNCAPPPGEVPLPAALPLFASSLIGGGVIAWRKKRKQKAELLTA